MRFSRRRAGRFALLALSLAAASVRAASPTPPAPAAGEPRLVIQAPHYGDGLFHFYQAHYFTAVTSLMVSQHFERVAPHADEAEVLRGGLLLSYGLHRQAGEIFAQLIERGAPPSVRDRAWFYLAKIRYQRGLPDDALAALSRIEGQLPAELDEERGLLHGQVLMARGDFAGAAGVLQVLAPRPGASRYVRYNLGVALVKTGDIAGGSALLEAIGGAPAEDEEARSLRDKANVALGFAALQADRPEDARKALERVRLASLQANKALLGFGWAAAALKQPKLALVPWTELAQRDGSDAAVLEARIALPYAYAELGAYGQALDRYQQAIAGYEREAVALDESVAAIRSGKMLRALDERNPGTEMGWFWTLRELPEMPHASHLAGVLAEHEFQEAFKNYRDLLFLERNLDDWLGKLAVFSDMLALRRQAFAERLPQVRERAGQVDLEALGKRAAAVTGEVAQVEATTDAAALADDKQRALLARVQSVKQALAAMTASAETEWARDRLRLAEGALTWDLNQQFPTRIWETRKSIKAIDAGLVEARGREAALAAAQRDEPARFAKFAERIADLTGQLKGMVPQVAALKGQQQQAVQDIAVAALARQKERLATYATQARFAVAQLQDRAGQTEGGSDASAQ